MATKKGIVSIPASGGEAGLNRYLAEIKKFPILSPEEEYMLAKRWREHGDTEAAAKLVNSHLRLVSKIAMGYRGYGLPVSELISEGTVDAALARSSANRKKIAIVEDGRGTRAVTHWKRLKPLRDASLVECRLETGRTHQVRVHMASIGHPLLGDPVYGRSRIHGKLLKELQFQRQALHAAELGFTHPVTKSRLSFSSPMPPDMQELFNALGV